MVFGIVIMNFGIQLLAQSEEPLFNKRNVHYNMLIYKSPFRRSQHTVAATYYCTIPYYLLNAHKQLTFGTENVRTKWRVTAGL